MKVLYHHPCVDGFSAAYLFHHFLRLEEKDLIPVSYGREPPWSQIKGEEVVIVDFSYPRDVLLSMKEQTRSLLVLDHHKSAQEDLQGLDFCVFDMERSGVMLAWDHLNKRPPDKDHWVLYVQDHDLYQFKLKDSHYHRNVFQATPFTVDAWTTLVCGQPEQRVLAGMGIQKYKERSVRLHLEHTTDVTLEGHRVPFLNCTDVGLVSELGHAMALERPFSVTWRRDLRKYTLSLRSVEGKEDVSVVAKALGGGGHKHAAGATLSSDQFKTLFG